MPVPVSGEFEFKVMYLFLVVAKQFSRTKFLHRELT